MEKTENGSGFLYEPLTRRERNILAHLANGRSSQEIAELETLAYSSVKWYIHQIYRKLGVNQRNDAITRARELGLLRPTPSSLSNAVLVKNNLPRQLTSFIGREEEIQQLLKLIQDLPLVTLTGSGGTGKTRLALQVADRALEAFPDGTWFVDLAPLADPGLVPLVTATALDMHAIPRSAVTQALGAFIGRKSLLMILDNCEHLVGASATLASELLYVCPHLHILATSREALGVKGEKPFRCPPLCLPDPQSHPTFPELAQSECIRLFTERAQTVSSSFRLTEANTPLVSRVCQQLDGIPLAIELAAARVRLLSMEQITARLDNIFHLLTGGGRTVLPRHQTLKALVDWSYDLLSVKERRLLCRLSVFAGSWTLEAAEAVCACPDDRDPLPTEEILDLLGQLVDKSLVSVQDGQGVESRYRMLEMIRQYARQRLLEGGGDEALREQHLAYYVELAQQAELHLRGKGQRAWLDRLDADLDNIRWALGWAMSGDIGKGLQLATALQWFWHMRNYWIEGEGWLDRLLAAEAKAVADTAPNVDTARSGNQRQHQPERRIIRGRALNTSGVIKVNWSDNERAIPLLEEARHIFQVYGALNQKDLAISLGHLAFIHKDLDRAITGMNQALDLLRKDGDTFVTSFYLDLLANLNIAKGNLAQARASCEECLAQYREVENVDGEASMLALLGFLELISGNPHQAAVLINKARFYLDSVGNRIYSAAMIDLLAHVAMSQGDYLQAIQRTETALAISTEMNSKVMMMNAISFLGWEAWALQDYDQAIRQCNKSLALARGLRPDLAITAQYILGRVALSRGEYSQAGAYLKELITWLNNKDEPFRINFIWSPYGFKGMNYPTYEAVNALGVLANAQHQVRRAAILFGAQAALCNWFTNSFSLAERNEYEQALASARAALGEEAFTAAWDAGQAMILEQAVAYALEEKD